MNTAIRRLPLLLSTLITTSLLTGCVIRESRVVQAPTPNIDIAIGATTPAAPVEPEPVEPAAPTLAIGEVVSLRSVNYPDHVIRSTSEFLATISSLDDGETADAGFRIVAGLDGAEGSISFESIEYPGHYLRHQGFALKLHRRTEDQLYLDDASFVPRRGLADRTAMSFESVNYPGYFIRHRDLELHLDARDDSDLYRNDASFKPEPWQDRITLDHGA